MSDDRLAELKAVTPRGDDVRWWLISSVERLEASLESARARIGRLEKLPRDYTDEQWGHLVEGLQRAVSAMRERAAKVLQADCQCAWRRSNGLAGKCSMCKYAAAIRELPNE